MSQRSTCLSPQHWHENDLAFLFFPFFAWVLGTQVSCPKLWTHWALSFVHSHRSPLFAVWQREMNLLLLCLLRSLRVHQCSAFFLIWAMSPDSAWSREALSQAGCSCKSSEEGCPPSSRWLCCMENSDSWVYPLSPWPIYPLPFCFWGLKKKFCFVCFFLSEALRLAPSWFLCLWLLSSCQTCAFCSCLSISFISLVWAATSFLFWIPHNNK